MSKQPDAVPVMTPTLLASKARRAQLATYWFNLNDAAVRRAAPLGDAALVAYAVIRAAAWGPRAEQWVTVSRRAEEAYGRGYRWWHAATTRLQKAGLVEVQRSRGRAPRYRLKADQAAPAVESGG